MNVVKKYLKHSFTMFRKYCKRNKKKTFLNVVETLRDNLQ